MKMETDAEHKQDHADLGQLGGDLGIANHARGVRTDHDPRDDVADDGRKSEPFRDQSEQKRRAQAERDGRDQWNLMHCPEPRYTSTTSKRSRLSAALLRTL